MAHVQDRPSPCECDEHSRLVFDAIPHLVWLAAPDGTATHFNRSFFDYAGHPTAGQPDGWRRAVHPDDLPAVSERWAEAVRTGRTLDVECRIRRADGAYRWHACRAQAEHDAGGRVVRWVGTCTDTHDRRQAEDVSRQAAAVLDRTSDGVVALDRDWRYTYLNPQAERLLKRTRDELLGKRIWDEFPETVGSDIERELRKAVATGEPAEFEARYQPLDSWSEIRAFPGPDGLTVYFHDISSRKAAEEARVRSEFLLRLVWDDAADGMRLADADGTVVMANDAYCRLVGRPAGEVVGRPLTDAYAPARRDRAAAEYRTRFTTLSAPARSEIAVELWDGRRRWFELGEALLELPGDPPLLLSVFRDETERHRAEQALRDRDELLRTVIDNIPCGVFWKDRNSAYLGCNDLVARNLGAASPAELTGKTDREMPFLPEEAEFYLACDRQVMETGEPLLNVEEAQTRSNGVHATLLTSKVPLRDAAGAVVGTLGVYLDITARKQAEEAARRSQALFKAFMDNSPVLAFIKDEDGRYMYANRRWEEQFTPPRRDWFGQPDTAFWPAEAAKLFRDSDLAALASNRPTERLETATTTDGDVRVFSTLKFPVLGPAGRRALGGIVADVTDQRKLEDQVRQSQKMEAVGRLAGGVAHDFNNILTAVNGFGELALEALVPGDPAREWVAEMVKAGDRAAGLTRQLLAFSRKQVLRPRVFDLNGLVAELERMLVRIIGEDVDLAARLDPDLGRVLADPGSVEQVLLNLAVNARDAMPAGGQLTIETREAELDEEYAATRTDVRPGRYAMLAVADTGSGMTPEVKARLFEPFFTTKPVGRGTGLGLAVVHGAVKQAGGHVEVYSELGLGTTFKVYLPLAGGGSRETVCRPETVAGGKETVLLVEDEPPVRALAARALRRAGYTVLEATDTKDALAVARGYDGPLDLLATDVVMPGGGGRVLAEQLAEARPGLRVLYLSGYTDDAVVRHGVLAESVQFLQKPFTPTALAAKVRQVLDAPREAAV